MIGDFLSDLHPSGDGGSGEPAPAIPDLPWGGGDAVSVLDATAVDVDDLPPAGVAPPAAGEHATRAVVCGVGTPDADAAHWHFQGPENACAVTSQGSIIESITGIPFDQAKATEWLRHQGWYDPATGTQPANLTRLFDAFGIPTSAGSTSIEGLWDALAAGDKVMVTLDANEIWSPQHDPVTGAPLESIQPAGHAVWLTGIEQTPDGGWQVVLNDSGREGGRAETVPLADFVEAWDDYRNHAVFAGGRTAPPIPNPTGVLA